MQRNTKFTTYAALTTDEIVTKSIETQTETIESIVARRAYDLMCHVMDHLSSYVYDTATCGQDLIDCIPDMTQLPKE